MDYLTLITAGQETLPLHTDIVSSLENLERFPLLLEKIYRDTVALDENALDQLRFALLRLQVYADIHQYENMEKAQKIKYVAQVLEKVIFGSLMLEREVLNEG
ncbi:MAG: hypothetical protein LUQ40_02610 [Methanomicrobiales archaeon]|nr:hypothetical protein [Methanomicrobiales archaeon]